MKKQDYHHHIRYYVPHHFVFYPVVMALMVFCAVQLSKQGDRFYEWLVLLLLAFIIAWLSFMMRQHYALTLQNRIVVLELRLRYYQLTGKRLETIEQELSFGQLAALRFASDEELPALTQKAVNENLSPDSIKKSIKNWLPDHSRV
jgi:hypothetical protein